jgi:hypothetical protein
VFQLQGKQDTNKACMRNANACTQRHSDTVSVVLTLQSRRVWCLCGTEQFSSESLFFARTNPPLDKSSPVPLDIISCILAEGGHEDTAPRDEIREPQKIEGLWSNKKEPA